MNMDELKTKKQTKKPKLAKIIILPLSLGLIFYASLFVFGQNGSEVNDEVKEINKQISQRKNQIEEIQKKQETYARALKQKQAEKASLANQLAILDNRIAKAELDLESAQIEIDRTNLEIQKTNLEIVDNEKGIAKEKEHIVTVLRLLYRQDQVSSLEILLLNDSFSEFLNQVRYLEDMNSELSDSLDALKKYKEQLDENKAALLNKSQELDKEKKDLEGKKDVLESEKENKGYVLEQTRSSEKEYQKLLVQAKQEQAAAAADIVSLEKTVREKLAQRSAKALEFNDNGFIWPVPENTITATFHDPDYPFRYIFEHPAIDIRAPQGSSVKAAASGYVARAKDGGKGYSYIMIIHGDGLATVYGHVSRIFVEEDEYVVQGQAIGASGGLPGTPGAGRLTTGAHLHFEIRLNGIPVDPLKYLP